MTLWETGASPIEVLNMRVKDVTFNQYGGLVMFSRYTSRRIKKVNKLKTPYRYRTVPIATSVPDLQLWLSMHPNKDEPEVPLWLSQRRGGLSYNQLNLIFKQAVKRAGIKKNLTPYSFRHMRLTQVADILSGHELKEFAGHSKYSRITDRYLHTNDKAIEKKILKERGIEVKEEEEKELTLKVKTCPRCKHNNSPAFKFCAMCSMPLDAEVMFEIQRKGELLFKGTHYPIESEEHNKLKEAFYKLQERNPELFKQLSLKMWEAVAVEIMKEKGAK